MKISNTQWYTNSEYNNTKNESKEKQYAQTKGKQFVLSLSQAHEVKLCPSLNWKWKQLVFSSVNSCDTDNVYNV